MVYYQLSCVTCFKGLKWHIIMNFILRHIIIINESKTLWKGNLNNIFILL